MRTSSTASLLVAALVMLRRPCTRNKATAQLLLERAAEHSELTPAEREACLDLAEDLDIERPEPAVVRTPRPAAPLALHPQGAGRGCKADKSATTTLHPQGAGRGCKADKSATTTLHPQGAGREAERSLRLSLVPGLPFAHDIKGVPV